MMLLSSPRFRDKCVILYAATLICCVKFATFHLPKSQFLLRSVVNKTSSGLSEKSRLIVLPNNTTLDLAQINFTFPSIEDRVKYYMGSWYNRTTNAFTLCSKAAPFYEEGMQRWSDNPYIFDEDTVTFIPNPAYSQDALRYYFSNAQRGSRFVMSFSDAYQSPSYDSIPGLIIKSRMASQNHFIGEPATGPIIGYLKTERHYIDPIEEMKRLKDSIPSWDNKTDALIWRGGSTGGGKRAQALSNIYKLDRTDIDVGFTSIVLQQDAEGSIPLEELHKFPIKKSMNFAEMLQYKYLLSIEGNDVANNLMLLLYSNSVVLQPLPTRVAWCMEDKLIPFYHYIPVKSDFSDLGVMIDWARKNDDLVQEIIRHSTEYVENLLVSEEAKDANDEIIRRMVGLYSAQFGDILAKCKGSTALDYRKAISFVCGYSSSNEMNITVADDEDNDADDDDVDESSITLWNNGALYDTNDFWSERSAGHLFHFSEIMVSSWLELKRHYPLSSAAELRSRLRNFVLSGVSSTKEWGDKWKQHNQILFTLVFPNARLWLKEDIVGEDQDMLFAVPRSRSVCMRGPQNHGLTRQHQSQINKLIAPWFQEFNADEWYSMMWNDALLSKLYNDVLTSGKNRKKLVVTYVDRQNTSRRLHDEWHQALIDMLTSREFDPIVEFVHAHMEQMPFEEQMKLARRTDVLIGVHGNGLTHELFMMPRRFLIEIFPDGQSFQYDYYFYARAMGHSYAVIDGDQGLLHVSSKFDPIGHPAAQVRDSDPRPLLDGVRCVINRAVQELLV